MQNNRIHKKIVAEVGRQVPKFNRKLLVEFPRKNINNMVEFLSSIYKEQMKLFKGAIEYIGYRVLSPHERAEIEINKVKGVSVTQSDVYLAAFSFRLQEKSYTAHVYLPYPRTHFIVYKNSKYATQLGITERIFSRMNNELIVRVIRLPLRFYRESIFKLQSAITGKYTSEFVITTILHNKFVKNKITKRNSKSTAPPKKKRLETTVLHYLLAKSGLVATMERFGLTPEDYSFVDKIGDDTESFEYFNASSDVKSRPIYFRIRREFLNEDIYRKLAANLLYILSGERSRYTIEGLYDPCGSAFRIIMGEIIHADVAEARAKNNTDTHINSVDSFADPFIIERFRNEGIYINDIYDLLYYIFVNIDKIMVNSSDNLFARRIITIEDLMVKIFAAPIFHRAYNIDQLRIGDKDLAQLVGISPHEIRRMCYQTLPTITPNPQDYYGNALPFLVNKVRLTGFTSGSGRAGAKVDEILFQTPSVAVETMVGLSGKSPGMTGMINPFIEIDKHGNIIRPDYADDLAKLEQ